MGKETANSRKLVSASKKGIEEGPHLLIVVRQFPIPDRQLIECELRLELKRVGDAESEGKALPPEPPVPAQHVAEGRLGRARRNGQGLAL